MVIWLVIVTRLKRGFSIGLVIALLFGILGWFLCLFDAFIVEKEQDIVSAYGNIPVTVTISNIEGTKTDDLGIPWMEYYVFTEDFYQILGVKQEIPFSSYVTDVVVRSKINYAPAEEPEITDNTLNGITDLRAAPELDASRGVAVDFFPGWDEGLFLGEEYACILSKEKFDCLESDSITILVEDASQNSPAKEVTLKIAGTYSGFGNDIYCPWNVVIAEQEAILGSTERTTVESLSATVKDNHQLEVFRELLARHFCQVDPLGRPVEKGHPLMPYYTYAATIHDETLRLTLKELNAAKQTLLRLQPLIVVLELLISGAVCFFAINTRKKELAIARSLGTPKRIILETVFMEMAIWSVFGIAAALALCKAFEIQALPILLAVFLASILGALLAAMLAIGRSVIKNIKEE